MNCLAIATTAIIGLSLILTPPLEPQWFDQLQRQGASALRLDMRDHIDQAQAAIAQLTQLSSPASSRSPKPWKLWLTLDPEDLEGDRLSAKAHLNGHTTPAPQLIQVLDAADIIELKQPTEPKLLDSLHYAIQRQLGPDQPCPSIIVSLDPDIDIEQLPELIVRGAGRYPFGIAIPPSLSPNGHLSDRSRACQKILDLCQAACIPVILMPPTELNPSSSLDGDLSQLAAIVRSPLQASPSSATS